MHSVDMQLPFMALRISASEQAILSIDFIHGTGISKQAPPSPLLREACGQISAYFQQKHFQFDLPLSPGGTDFQGAVWSALQTIPWGQVQTYGELATRLGTSPRALGNACRRNPIPLIIPCHRVVSRSGIGGYAGDTQGAYLQIKRQLLAHEGLEF